jgi:serine/threonine-protein kinase
MSQALSCPTCGKSLPVGAKFCGFDGTDLTLSSTDGKRGGKVCSVCNRFYPSYAKFCAFDRSTLHLIGADGADPSEAEPAASRQPTQNVSQSRPSALTAETGTVDVRHAIEATAAVPNSRLVEDEPDDSNSTLVGKTIDGKYLIQSPLGEGGMAVVYKANHIQMERTVVIKVMQGWLLSNRNSVERFERECKLTAKLNHPNIVSVYDVGSINGKEPYLDKIDKSGALPYATTGNIIVQICRGLQEAHSNGIIHRDLKPDNVLLQHKSDRPDWVKIVDFGISNLVQGSKRLTKTGRMVGTPEYIAPEQLKDRPIDIRTDLYGIGVMMFEMLTGHVPFDGESAEAILMKHLLEDPPPMSEVKPDLPQPNPFQSIVDKLMRKDPDERYQTATELRLDVEQALNSVLLKKNSAES